MLIGLAGKTGAGKNYIAQLLEGRGWRVLDLDVVAHQALDELAGDIDSIIGPGLVKEGKIDRKQLGRVVFAQTAALATLEEITYPWIEKKTRAWISEAPEIPAVINAVNLHKTSLTDEMDALIWVSAPKRVRKKRVMKRDGRDWNDLKGRFQAQKGLNPKLFSSNAEIYSMRNSGKRETVEKRLDRILSRLWSGDS